MLVTFAREDVVLQTREGIVAYRKGDALLRGGEDDTWPVAFEHFKEVYVPIGNTVLGEDGNYSKKALPTFALQVEEPFVVELSDEKGLLQGTTNDWLLQYAPNNYGVVAQEIFEMTYEVAEPPINWDR
jgi:hypothetical protein